MLNPISLLLLVPFALSVPATTNTTTKANPHKSTQVNKIAAKTVSTLSTVASTKTKTATTSRKPKATTSTLVTTENMQTSSASIAGATVTATLTIVVETNLETDVDTTGTLEVAPPPPITSTSRSSSQQDESQDITFSTASTVYESESSLSLNELSTLAESSTTSITVPITTHTSTSNSSQLANSNKDPSITNASINDNTSMIPLIMGCVCAAALLLAGYVWSERRKFPRDENVELENADEKSIYLSRLRHHVDPQPTANPIQTAKSGEPSTLYLSNQTHRTAIAVSQDESEADKDELPQLISGLDAIYSIDIDYRNSESIRNSYEELLEENLKYQSWL